MTRLAVLFLSLVALGALVGNALDAGGEKKEVVKDKKVKKDAAKKDAAKDKLKEKLKGLLGK